MKRVNNLFDKIVDYDNLYLAYIKAKRNKSRRKEVRVFEQDTEQLLKKLQQQLIDGTYRTSEYKTFTIYEPKERIIFKLPFYPDRIVHHAIMNILEPIWVSIFISHTYSCIKGRGIHKAVKDIKRDLKDVEGTKYCLKLDIRKFYPSIDHTVLKTIIRKKIKDNKLLQLLDNIVDSTDGVPIGNYLSQFFANLMLAYFDHWVKEVKKVKYYYRYADDIVVLASSKEYLSKLLQDIDTYVTELKLSIKSNYQIYPVQSRGLSFVGYVFYHTHTKLRKNIKVRLARSSSRYKQDKVKYGTHISPYLGWLKYCNSYCLSNKIIVYKELLVYIFTTIVVIT